MHRISKTAWLKEEEHADGESPSTSKSAVEHAALSGRTCQISAWPESFPGDGALQRYP